MPALDEFYKAATQATSLLPTVFGSSPSSPTIPYSVPTCRVGSITVCGKSIVNIKTRPAVRYNEYTACDYASDHLSYKVWEKIFYRKAFTRLETYGKHRQAF